jgi:hypothetical protein
LNFKPQVVVGRVEVIDVLLPQRAVAVPAVKPSRSNHLADAVFAALGFNM